MTELPLRDAFQRRSNRFRLLDLGIRQAGWQDQVLKLLEIGCANGGAAEYLAERQRFDLVSIDIDSEVIEKAREEHPARRFLCADACALPFPDGSFDGVFSEAAFAVIPDKAAAVSEYARVLKPGGRVLINDFFLRKEPKTGKKETFGIPCVDGVGTLASYLAVFQSAGFVCVYQKESFYDYLAIADSLSKCYTVRGRELGAFLQKEYGRNVFVEDFFSRSGISYIQLIFEKKTDEPDL